MEEEESEGKEEVWNEEYEYVGREEKVREWRRRRRRCMGKEIDVIVSEE